MYARASHSNPERRLRFVVCGGLGDCLLGTPLLRHFKNVAGYRRIECWCPPHAAELFIGNPDVERVHAAPFEILKIMALPETDWDVFAPYLNLSSENPSRAVLQRGRNLDPRPLLVQIAAEHGLQLADMRPGMYPDSDDRRWAAGVAEAWGGKPVVHFNPRSALPEKDLPADVAAATATKFAGRFDVVMFGEHQGLSAGPGLHLLPLPTLRQLAALYEHVDCAVTVDSFPAHLAAATGVPAVVLYGPTNPACWGHPGQVLLRPSECPPCADSKRRNACERARCTETLTPETIFSACCSLCLQQSGGGER